MPRTGRGIEDSPSFAGREAAKSVLFAGFRPGYAFATNGGDILLRDLMVHLRAFGVTAELHGSGQMFGLWARGRRHLRGCLDAAGCVGAFSDDRLDYRSERRYFGECRLFQSHAAQLAFFEEQLRRRRWDVVVASFMGADVLAQLCQRHGVPVLLLVQEWQEAVTRHNAKVFVARDLPLLVPSRYLQRLLRKEHGYDSTLIYNKVDYRNCLASRGRRRKYITILSGSPLKGIDTFLAVAERLPEQQFMVVDGWGNWSSISREHRSRIRRLDNVWLLPTQADMRKVYARVSMLLVPSIWQEVFGRVVVEAQINRIPVIASNRGGLPEAVGKGGILLDEYQNVDKWVEAITTVQHDEDLRETLVRQGEKNARRFGTNVRDQKLMNLINGSLFVSRQRDPRPSPVEV